MPVLGKGGSSAVPEAAATALGTIAAGDPVILNSGVASKIAGKDSSVAWASTSYGYFDDLNSSLYYANECRLRTDSANGRAALFTHLNGHSSGAQKIVGVALAANGAHTGNGGPAGGSQLKALGSAGTLFDAIWDEANDSWVTYGCSFDGNAYYSRAKTTDGQTFTVTYSGGQTAHFCQSFVKDASDRIYGVFRNASAPNQTFVRRVNFSDSISSGGDPTAGYSGTNGAQHTTTIRSIVSCYDELNDQIITISNAQSTSILYQMNAYDIDSSGATSYSHSQQINSNFTFLANVLTGTDWQYHQRAGLTDLKSDGQGNIVAVMGNGGFFGISNNGSAFSFGETRSGFFGSASDIYTGLFMQQATPGQFISTRVAAYNGGLNAITGTFFAVSGGKVSGSFASSVLDVIYQNSGRGNIPYTNTSQGNFIQKFALAGTSDVLYVPKNSNNRYTYLARGDYAASSLNTGILGGVAKTGATNGNSLTVNLSGAEQTGLSSKSSGTKYYVNRLGAIVDAIPDAPMAFLGTGLSSTTILLGKTIDLTDPTTTFSSVASGFTTSGFETDFNSGYSWINGIQQHTDVITVSVTGDGDLLNVQGSGRVEFLFASYAGSVYANQNLGCNVYVDGVQIYTTGIHGTGAAQPLSVVGEIHKQSTNTGYGYLNHSDLRFNKSFRVERMSSSVATSLYLCYRIIGESS